MRLTNVSQMDLVDGRIASYGALAAPGLGRRLPVSFDQGRHVGAGQRPGSWLAIAFRLRRDVRREDLSAAWDAVVARHGTLSTVFTQDDDGPLELHHVEAGPSEWVDHEVVSGRRTREVLRDILDEYCAPFQQFSHRLVLIQPPAEAPDPRPEIVLGSDHAHVDMWSLVLLARDLLTALDDVEAGREPGAELPFVPGFAEHTAELEAMPDAPEEVHQRWREILAVGDGQMPIFPLPLGELDPTPGEVVEVRDVLGADETARLTALARERGVRPIALGISVLTSVTRELADRSLRAVFPVHSRHDVHWREAVGWFITNAVIESRDPDPVACFAAVEEATGLGSWPLAPILARHGHLPTPAGLFAISWLDARRLPLPTAQASDLRYVSATIRTNGVMIWFAVDEAGLHLRCRYPDTPEARENVGRWLDAVQLGLQELVAREPAG